MWISRILIMNWVGWSGYDSLKSSQGICRICCLKMIKFWQCHSDMDRSHHCILGERIIIVGVLRSRVVRAERDRINSSHKVVRGAANSDSVRRTVRHGQVSVTSAKSESAADTGGHKVVRGGLWFCPAVCVRQFVRRFVSASVRSGHDLADSSPMFAAGSPPMFAADFDLADTGGCPPESGGLRICPRGTVRRGNCHLGDTIQIHKNRCYILITIISESHSLLSGEL